MLDCHILTLPDTPPDWLAQCLDSARLAASRAGYPMHIHALKGIVGHVGRGRAIGYALGTQPYVTYVDCDDYVLPDAFAALADALAQRPEAVFPAESTIQNGKLRPGLQRHHLCCYRRDQLIDHRQWVVCGDLAQMHAAERGRCIDVPDRVYIHRLYQSPGRILRRSHHDELRMAHA